MRTSLGAASLRTDRTGFLPLRWRLFPAEVNRRPEKSTSSCICRREALFLQCLVHSTFHLLSRLLRAKPGHKAEEKTKQSLLDLVLGKSPKNSKW